MTCKFTGTKPGEYEVLAEVSGHKYVKVFVEISDQKLAVKPTPSDWAAFKLRKVTLKPIAGH